VNWSGGFRTFKENAGWFVAAFGAGGLLTPAAIAVWPTVVAASWAVHLVLAGVGLAVLPRLQRLLARLGTSLRAGLAQATVGVCICAISGFTVRVWGAANTAHDATVIAVTTLILFGVSSARRQPPLKDADEASREAPITKHDQDLFGLEHFIQGLTASALSGPNTVVALTGPLGTGKSSALNLLDEELQKAMPQPVIVRFSPWLPHGPSGLAAALSDSLASAIGARFVVPNGKLRLRAFARALSAGPPGLSVRLDELVNHGSQEDVTDALGNAIAGLPVRLIVLLDEIDRMDKSEIQELFKFLRGAPKLTNICFVCALDPEAAAQTIRRREEDLLVARSRLEKFFGIRFNLPVPPAEALCGLAQEGMRSIFQDEQGDAFSEALSQIEIDWGHYGLLFSTPRRVKTLLGAARHLRAAARVPVHPLDALNLVSLWHLNPALVTDVVAHWVLFAHSKWATWSETSAPGAFAESFGGDEKRKEYFDAHLSGKAPASELEIAILCKLFPEVANWKHAHGSGLSEDVALNSHRICHPRYTLQYLCAAVPGALMADAELRRLKEKLNAVGTANEARHLVVEAMHQSGRPRWFDLLNQLCNLAESLGADALEGMVMQLASSLPNWRRASLAAVARRERSGLYLFWLSALAPAGSRCSRKFSRLAPTMSSRQTSCSFA